MERRLFSVNFRRKWHERINACLELQYSGMIKGETKCEGTHMKRTINSVVAQM